MKSITATCQEFEARINLDDSEFTYVIRNIKDFGSLVQLSSANLNEDSTLKVDFSLLSVATISNKSELITFYMKYFNSLLKFIIDQSSATLEDCYNTWKLCSRYGLRKVNSNAALESYLSRARQNQILVLLDLGSTILFQPWKDSDPQTNVQMKNIRRPCDFEMGHKNICEKNIYFRPGVTQLLKFLVLHPRVELKLCSNFAAKKIRDLKHALFSQVFNQEDYPVLSDVEERVSVFGQQYSHQLKYGKTKHDFQRDYQAIWDSEEFETPAGPKFGRKNTVIIEWSKHKFSEEIDNVLMVPQYRIEDVDEERHSAHTGLGKVQVYMERLLGSDLPDVRDYLRKHY